MNNHIMRSNDFTIVWKFFCAAAAAGGGWIPDELLAGAVPTSTPESIVAALIAATERAWAREGAWQLASNVSLECDGASVRIRYVSCSETSKCELWFSLMPPKGGYTAQISVKPEADACGALWVAPAGDYYRVVAAREAVAAL